MPILQLDSVSRSYLHKGKTVKALDAVSLSVERADFIAILGPSGAGKTTLLNTIGFMHEPDSGRYLFDSRDTAVMTPLQRADLLARKTGFVFQAYNLLPYLTAGENVGLGLHYSGLAADQGYIRELLKIVGLDGLQDRKPAELSAGQQQRVAIARAMAKRPELILADEPTGNLDDAAAGEIIKLFGELNRQGATVLFVTHNRVLAGQAARVLEMAEGRIVSDARPARVAADVAAAVELMPLPAPSAAGVKPWSYAVRSAFRSIRRHPVKNVFLVLTISAAFFASSYFELMVSDFKGKRIRALADQTGVLVVTPAQDPRPGKLTLKDMGALEKVKSVLALYPSEVFYGEVTAGLKSYKTVVQAQTPWLISKNGVSLLRGRVFNISNVKEDEEVIIGEQLAVTLFGSIEAAPGKTVNIRKIGFRVSGVFKQGKQVFFPIQPDSVIMPYVAAQEHGFVAGSGLAAIYAVTRDFAAAESDGRAIAALLSSSHRLKPGEALDFNLISARCRETPAEVEQGLRDFKRYYLYMLLGSLLGLAMVFVLALSGIKKEILILKSLGCRRALIAAQVVLEMFVISLAGIIAGAGLTVAARGFWGLNWERFFSEPSGCIVVGGAFLAASLSVAAAQALAYYHSA